MNLTLKRLILRNTAALAPMLLLLATATVGAQTWVANREGPSLSEVLAIDATGEDSWLWGAEDVAGNGQNAFPAPEQEIDARTAYVATDGTRFYSRVYFSIAAAPPGNVTTFVFIDSDRDATTGGRALATELDPSFTTDPTGTRYEYAIKVQRTVNGAAAGALWRYEAATQQFVEVTTQPGQLVAETSFYDDPLRINQISHGYVQSSVDLGLVGLTQACDANIFVRTTNQTASLGQGDLDVGEVAHSCVPQVGNDNVPVVVNPPPGCTSNAQCANGGICVNGTCVFAPPCSTNADCPATDACLDGRCVVVGGTACANSSQCNGLLCENGVCVVCTTNPSCGPGFICGPDGRCIAGNMPIPCTESSTCNGLICINGQCLPCTADTVCGAGFVCDSTGRCLSTQASSAIESDAGKVYVAPGERLQGGACACRSTLGAYRSWVSFVGLLGIIALLGRNVKRERHG